MPIAAPYPGVGAAASPWRPTRRLRLEVYAGDNWRPAPGCAKMPGMTEQPQQQPAEAPVPGVVVTGEPEAPQPTESIASPAKVMRIGAMVRQLLEEVRHAPLDEAGRDRMREIYDISVRELADSLSPDLAQELSRVARPFAGEETPSEAELRVAQAQLVGWLEGLFHGIQATLFAQQMSARNQLEEMRRRAIPGRPGPGSDPTGQYL
jgi:Bacterial proteasome activator